MTDSHPSHIVDSIAVTIGPDGVVRVAASHTATYRVRMSWGVTRQSVTVTALSDAIGAYNTAAALNDAHETASRRATEQARALATAADYDPKNGA